MTRANVALNEKQNGNGKFSQAQINDELPKLLYTTHAIIKH